jgi:hypothetical protein
VQRNERSSKVRVDPRPLRADGGIVETTLETLAPISPAILRIREKARRSNRTIP